MQAGHPAMLLVLATVVPAVCLHTMLLRKGIALGEASPLLYAVGQAALRSCCFSACCKVCNSASHILQGRGCPPLSWHDRCHLQWEPAGCGHSECSYPSALLDKSCSCAKFCSAVLIPACLCWTGCLNSTGNASFPSSVEARFYLVGWSGNGCRGFSCAASLKVNSCYCVHGGSERPRPHEQLF